MIKVYGRDHMPPHVHVAGPDFEVVVYIKTLETESNAPAKIQRMARELVAKNIDICLAAWNEYHEED